MIEKEFVTYEIALALKELGYPQKLLNSRLGSFDERGVLHYRNIIKKGITAPLWQQTIDWFREKHNLEINIYDNSLEKKYAFIIGLPFSNKIIYSSGKWMNTNSSGEYYKTFEEARKQAIIKAIELLTNE